MQELHKKNKVNFDDLQSQIDDRKKNFMQNLEEMRNKMNQHDKLFNSVHTMADKLPDIFDHFKNMVKNLGQKELTDLPDDLSDEEPEDDEIEQHDHTIEEDAFDDEDDYDEEDEDFGDEDDEDDYDEEDEDFGDEDDEDDYDDEEDNDEEADEGMNSTDDDLDKNVDWFDDKMNEVGDHPNMIPLNDDIMDKLEQEQKEYEIRQKEQNEHIQELRNLDDGLLENGRRRRNFNDRFIKYLNSDHMRRSPEDVRQHLKHLNNLFNARQI
jgi:hypothetical protein